MKVALLKFGADTEKVLGDLIYVLFLLIVVWIAITGGDDLGGGRRARLPVPL
ncbi:MAG: hypothetical protein R2762_10000 [Bryobacteraceae bacterium]